MAKVVTLDPQFQVPESLSIKDPAHPLNLVQSVSQLQNQAATDAQYDLPTPERYRMGKKEGFQSLSSHNYLIILGILLFVVTVIPIRIRARTRLLFGFAAVSLVLVALFLQYRM